MATPILVKVDFRTVTISPAYVADLASEYLARELIATTTTEHVTEFQFEGPNAAANAKAFRQTLDTCFHASDPGTLI
jgi:hypothetical protein